MRRLSALAAAALLAGCASKGSTLVVVVPGESGHVGGVVVDSGSQQQVLDQPYAATVAGADGQLKADTLSDREVNDLFADARRARPMKPVSFTLYFEEGTDRFSAESRPEVEHVFAEIARRPAVEITVIGHTDRVGYKKDNDVLSRVRAERVRRELVKQGIAPEIIKAAGRGEREPVVPTPDEKSEPRNRRVEISVR